MIDSRNLIGRNKYAALKRYDFVNMSAEDMVRFRNTHKISVAEAEKQIKNYEDSKKFTGSNPEVSRKYLEKLKNIGEVAEIKITIESLWKSFLRNFKELEGKNFNQKQGVLENIKPLFYYFTEDFEKFKNCSRVSSLSTPSLDKGILIVGDFGNGKSTTMKTLEKSLRNTHKYFKGYSANDVVLEFEGCGSPTEKTNFIKRFSKGVLYFDDVKSERKASNYNTMEVFREILENRYNNKSKTFITCNYKKGFESDLKPALNEFGEKYGDRVNDRIYEMFNIIEFKGKTFRV